MKKYSIFLLIVFSASFHVNAQDSLNLGDKKTFCQQAGESSLEMNFNPGNIFGSGTGNPFGLINGTIRYRYFLDQNLALRAAVSAELSNSTLITQQADPENNRLELKSRSLLYGITLKPGIEKHFSNFQRFSPYLGGQVLAGFSTNSDIYEHQNLDDIYLVKYKNFPGKLDLGVEIFGGFDFYFAKKLYLGLELGYGIRYTKFLKEIYTNELYPDQNMERKNGHTINFSPSQETGLIRLGWVF